MYSIYIREFVRNNVVVHGEEKMYDIPGNYPDEEMLISPKVKTEMGKASTFEFKMEPGNPWYATMMQMRTRLRVEYDGTTIFYGRVLSLNINMMGEKTVHCEGALAFLIDTLMQSSQKDNREKITLKSYINSLLSSHNNLADSWKRIWPGELPGHYSAGISDVQKITDNVEREFGSDSWTSILNCFEDLTSQYGGYLRTRFCIEQYTDTIGRYGLGNIDLNNRIVIHNPDGSISTEKSFSTNIDDEEVLLPTIINGVEVSTDDAIAHYDDTGEYLGKFNTVQAACDYAQLLHERQEWYYGGQGTVERIYLDWLKYYYNPVKNNQPIRVGANLIDISGTVDVNNIFTALIPEGTSKGKPLYLDDPRPYTIKVPVRRKKDEEEPGQGGGS